VDDLRRTSESRRFWLIVFLTFGRGGKCRAEREKSNLIISRSDPMPANDKIKDTRREERKRKKQDSISSSLSHSLCTGEIYTQININKNDTISI